MEYTMNNGFTELNAVEMAETDGGFAITLGAAIAIGCFVGGTGLGVAWAFCD